MNNRFVMLVKICNFLIFFQHHVDILSETFVWQPVYNDAFIISYKLVRIMLQLVGIVL